MLTCTHCHAKNSFTSRNCVSCGYFISNYEDVRKTTCASCCEENPSELTHCAFCENDLVSNSLNPTSQHAAQAYYRKSAPGRNLLIAAGVLFIIRGLRVLMTSVSMYINVSAASDELLLQASATTDTWEQMEILIARSHYNDYYIAVVFAAILSIYTLIIGVMCIAKRNAGHSGSILKKLIVVHIIFIYLSMISSVTEGGTRIVITVVSLIIGMISPVLYAFGTSMNQKG